MASVISQIAFIHGGDILYNRIRYQTGEIPEIVQEIKKGSIPCMDVADYDELNWVIKELAALGVYRVEEIPYDKTARDRIKEPEFEFRAAFTDRQETGEKPLMYIDFYFDPDVEETYDSVGEM